MPSLGPFITLTYSSRSDPRPLPTQPLSTDQKTMSERAPKVWAPEEERALLTWLGENKRCMGDLKAWKEWKTSIHDHLRHKFAGTQFEDAITYRQLESKLSHYARRQMLPGHKGIQELYERGTDVLNIERLLESRPLLKNIYPNKEITHLLAIQRMVENESKKRKSSHNSNSSTDGVLALDDQKDREEEEIADSASPEQEQDEDYDPNKRQKLKHRIPPKHSAPKSPARASVNSAHSREGNLPVEDISMPPDATFSSQTQSAMGILPTVFRITDRETNNPSMTAQHEDLRSSSIFNKNSSTRNLAITSHIIQPPKPPDTSSEQSSGEAFPRGLDDDALMRLSHLSAPSPEERGVVGDMLNDIGARAFEAVRIFLTELKFKDYQPIVLEPELRLPSSLEELLMKVLGCLSKSNIPARCEKFMAFQVTSKVSLRTFLESLMMTAVTEWCLTPSLLEAHSYVKLGNGIVSEAIRQQFNEAAQKHMELHINKEYIRREFIPNIEIKANAMALKFRSMIFSLLPGLSTVEEHKIRFENVIPCPPHAPWLAASITLPTTTVCSPQPYADFGTRLAAIFKIALSWRAEMEMIGNGEYMFEMLGFQDRFSDSVTGFPDPDRIGVAVLGLRPTVSRRTRQSVLDNYGEWQVLVHGKAI